MRLVFFSVFSLFLVNSAFSDSNPYRFESVLEVSQRAAYRIKEDKELAQNKLAARLELRAEPSNSTSLTVIGRTTYDQYYTKQEFDQDSVEDHQTESNIREAYLDYFVSDFSIRVGKQQVTWGESDYFRVLDVINPIDLRDFLLPYTENFQEARNTLNMINLIHQGEVWETQLLYIPSFETNTLPSHTADFSPTELSNLVNQVGNLTEATPDANLTNAAWGINTKAALDWGDLGFYGYSGWNSEGVFSFKDSKPTFSFHRRQFLGLSVSQPVGAIVLRADYAHRIKERMAVNPASGRQYSENDVNEVLIGTDYNNASLNVGVQVSHKEIMNYSEILTQSKQSNSFSLYVSQDFLGDRLKVSHLVMGVKRDLNTLNETRLIYHFSDKLIGTIGLDWFKGKKSTTYGQFKQQSRIFSGVKYFF